MTFNIIRSLLNDHTRLKPVPSFQSRGTSQGKFWQSLHKSVQGHLRVLNAAKDLAAATSPEETIHSSSYLFCLESLLPVEAQHVMNPENNNESKFKEIYSWFNNQERSAASWSAKLEFSDQPASILPGAEKLPPTHLSLADVTQHAQEHPASFISTSSSS